MLGSRRSPAATTSLAARCLHASSPSCCCLSCPTGQAWRRCRPIAACPAAQTAGSRAARVRSSPCGRHSGPPGAMCAKARGPQCLPRCLHRRCRLHRGCHCRWSPRRRRCPRARPAQPSAPRRGAWTGGCPEGPAPRTPARRAHASCARWPAANGRQRQNPTPGGEEREGPH